MIVCEFEVRLADNERRTQALLALGPWPRHSDSVSFHLTVVRLVEDEVDAQSNRV